MKWSNIAFALLLMTAPTVALAKVPAQNISSSRHGNLAAAQSLVRQASDRISAAQQANEFDLAGHAGHAKQLLIQASNELKLAARTANGRGR